MKEIFQADILIKMVENGEIISPKRQIKIALSDVVTQN